MRLVVTALVFLIGLFMLLLALSFLFQPETTAATIGIAASTTQGLSTLRGDFLGFFGIIGISMLWGAWRRNGDLLLLPAIIMLVVIAGRIVSVIVDGPYDGYLAPMVIEAAIAGLLFAARAMLPHHTVEEIAG